MTFLLWLATIPVALSFNADYVIRDLTIYDGSGREGMKGDIAIRSDRIVNIGKFEAKAKKVIDGKGLLAAPGFIDLHTHSDLPEDGDSGEPAILKKELRANLNFLFQGVTTVITGNCGSGQVEVGEFFQRLETNGIGTNVIHQIPLGELRQKVMGNRNRAPTEKELEKMKFIIAEGMKEGAWGISTGLIYPPGAFSKTDEITELARVARRYGGHYASHIRDEGFDLLPSVKEAIEIGRKAAIPVHISHLKADRPAVWGKASEALQLIRESRRAGQVVTADQYPYAACSTSLADEVIPATLRAGTFLEDLKVPALRQKIRKEIEKTLRDYRGGQTIQIASFQKNRSWQGRRLTEIAKEEKISVADLVLKIEEAGGASIVDFSMSEEEVRGIMKEPFVATASDGRTMAPSHTQPHPRSYGTFPRKISHYALKNNVISLPFAIRSSTGLPAEILGLKDRGLLKEGFFADVVIFNPILFEERATFAKPHQYASGVRYLFVNGTLAISRGKYTRKLPGRVLRKNEKGVLSR